jgi:hypothetical protein
VLVKVLAEKEERLSGDAEWEIQRIRGDRTQLADLFYMRPWWSFSTGLL